MPLHQPINIRSAAAVGAIVMEISRVTATATDETTVIYKS